MDSDRIFMIGIMVCFLTLFLAIMFGMFMVLVDSFTWEEVGTIEKPCIDDEGNKFVDEMCEEEVFCSKHGWLTRKCSSKYIKDIKFALRSKHE